MKLIFKLLTNALAVYLSSEILPGVALTDFITALVVALVLGLLNILVKPILLLLALPINVLTLGLFTFFINALVVLLASRLVAGFKIRDFLTAMLFSLVLSLISSLLRSLIK